MMLVTGQDGQGLSLVQVADTPSPLRGLGGDFARLYDIWRTEAAPARVEPAAAEPCERPWTMTPSEGGTALRVLDLLPGHAASIAGWRDRHPGMHRTDTVDYCVVLEGELTLILEREELALRRGDIVVQCATEHAWENRSDETARVVFVMVDALVAVG